MVSSVYLAGIFTTASKYFSQESLALSLSLSLAFLPLKRALETAADAAAATAAASPASRSLSLSDVVGMYLLAHKKNDTLFVKFFHFFFISFGDTVLKKKAVFTFNMPVASAAYNIETGVMKIQMDI